MGWATWYYGGEPFPVLQAVYPDLENRFPEDVGFDSAFRQPLLQPDAPMTVVENDFWASADPSSSLFNWKFPYPPHTQVFLSEAVHSGAEPVTHASHDLEDGAWQFLGDSMAVDGKPIISCFHHPIDNDPTLNELADLPYGGPSVQNQEILGFATGMKAAKKPRNTTAIFTSIRYLLSITYNKLLSLLT